MLYKWKSGCDESDGCGEVNRVPQTRMKQCSRIVIFLSVLFFLVLVYLPLYYPPNFSRKPIDVVVDGWGVNISRALPTYVVPSKETAVIADRSYCSQSLLLLIIVCSNVGNFYERSAIRDTWGNFSSPDYQVVFLLGMTDNVTIQENVEIESVLHRDVIQEGFIDSYNNLTLKSVMLLKQVATYCPHVEFVLKSDDDMFVHVLNLLRLIRSLKDLNINNVLLGELICNAKPIQDISSKWYSPSYMYDGKVYPQYLSGTGYLMDRHAALKLYEAALVTPFFHLEDVYITGLCAKRADIKPRDHPGFSYQTRPVDPCLYTTYKYIITSHRVSPEKMRQLWSALSNPSKKCPKTAKQPQMRYPALNVPFKYVSPC